MLNMSKIQQEVNLTAVTHIEYEQKQHEVNMSPDMKELATGYKKGTTAIEGLSSSIRHKLLGACMDHNISRSKDGLSGSTKIMQRLQQIKPWLETPASYPHQEHHVSLQESLILSALPPNTRMTGS